MRETEENETDQCLNRNFNVCLYCLSLCLPTVFYFLKYHVLPFLSLPYLFYLHAKVSFDFVFICRVAANSYMNYKSIFNNNLFNYNTFTTFNFLCIVVRSPLSTDHHLSLVRWVLSTIQFVVETIYILLTILICHTYF